MSTIKIPISSAVTKLIATDMEDDDIAVFLAGESAIGKTALLNALEEIFGAQGVTTKVYLLAVNQIADKGDLCGVQITEEDDPNNPDHKRLVYKFIPHETLVTANDYARANPDERVVIVMDEVNRTGNPDVTNSVLGYQTNWKVGEMVFAPNIRFAYTGNLTGNITAMDDASVSRFAVYEVYPTAEEWLKYTATSHPRGVYPAIEKVLTDHPEYIFMKPKSGDDLDENTPDDSPRTETEMSLDLFGEGEKIAQFTAPRTLTGLNSFCWRIDPDGDCTGDRLNELLTAVVDTDPFGKSSDTSTLFHAAVLGHTGDTLFTRNFIGVVLHNSGTTVTGAPVTGQASNASRITRPDFWDAIDNATSRTGVTVACASLGVDEIVEGIVYGLTVPASPHNTQAVVTLTDLANDITKLPTGLPDAATDQLISAASTGRLDSTQVTAFADGVDGDTGHPFASFLEDNRELLTEG